MIAYVSKSRLEGEISLSGAKNNSLRLLVVSLLSSKKLVLLNAPSNLLDLKLQCEMLEYLGKKVSIKGEEIVIEEYENLKTELLWNKRSIRNTLLILGALLARKGSGKVPLPGGCKLGERKYDIHVDIMRKLGAQVWEEDEYLCAASESRLKGCELHLPMRSTGATENAILMASLAEGHTKIWNPHIRPEIIDMISMLKDMGVHIKVNGQESIDIWGVEALDEEIIHTCIPDNVEAMTFVIAAAITNGEIKINDFPMEHLEIPMIYLRESGLNYLYSEKDKSLIVSKGSIYPFDIVTGPYPAMNSDMQPLFAAYALFAKGISYITDLRFYGRYGYANELAKMGAKTFIKDIALGIEGNHEMYPADTIALDLRAGAALTLAALGIEGESRIFNYEQVLRGYDNFEYKLTSLGAKFTIVDEHIQ